MKSWGGFVSICINRILTTQQCVKQCVPQKNKDKRENQLPGSFVAGNSGLCNILRRRLYHANHDLHGTPSLFSYAKGCFFFSHKFTQTFQLLIFAMSSSFQTSNLAPFLLFYCNVKCNMYVIYI